MMMTVHMTKHAFLINALIHAEPILVAKMPNVKPMHIEQCADVQKDGLESHTLSATNVGFQVAG